MVEFIKGEYAYGGGPWQSVKEINHFYITVSLEKRNEGLGLCRLRKGKRDDNHHYENPGRHAFSPSVLPR